MPRFQLLPVEESFFDWFDKAAATMLQAGEELLNMVKDFTDVPRKVARITELEHQGDFVVHEINDLLAKTFVLPLDREEIHNLSGRMDDVIDHIEAAADALLLYKVTKPTPTAVELAQLIYASTREISLAVPLLRDNKDLRKINQHAIEINRLENDADRVFRAGMAALLEQDDLFELFRWKAIYDLLEEATDCCEDVADVLQGIVMRNL